MIRSPFSLMADRIHWWNKFRRMLNRPESAPDGRCLGCGGPAGGIWRSPSDSRASALWFGPSPASALHGLCADCYAAIPWITRLACRVCGRASPCPDCRRTAARHFVCSRSAVQYTPLMKDWLRMYKFRGHEKMAPLFGHMLMHGYRLLAAEMRGRRMIPDAVTFVPVSAERIQERGFNQAEQLARCLGRTAGLSVLPLLMRVRHGGRQSTKSRRDRLKDLSGAFAKLPGADAFFPAQRRPQAIILVDDVYTTGSTLNECARVLREEWGAAVFGLTWAR